VRERRSALTSNDVARAAGVSQATVSRVLNGSALVTADTRQRVLAVLDQLDYVPNASAKAMRTSRAGAIGVVASEMLNPYFPLLLETVTQAAAKLDLGVVLWNDDSADAVMAQAGVSSGAVDGVMFVAAKANSTGVEIMSRRQVPVMLVSRAEENAPVDSVMSDHETTGYDAARYFLDRSRRDIAILLGPEDSFASPARDRGFQRALHEHGLAPAQDLRFTGSTSYTHGWATVMRMIDDGTLPSSIYCTADVIAFGAITALRERSIRVPEDVWVMGTDGLPMSSWNVFDLTTHQQQVSKIAELAVARLGARISGEVDEPLHVRIPTSLVVRGSTAHA
jgi:LacI family transcriptional regulator